MRDFLFIFYVWIYNLIIRTYNYIRGVNTNDKYVETIVDISNKYIILTKERFLSKIVSQNTNPSTDICKTLNTNIAPIFYSKKEYNQLMEKISNYLEQQWKTRILIENTPKGNIIMYYDAYKLGFAYYSDVNGIDYHMLNAVAMKYVLTFHCLDFFVDEQIYDKSILIKLYMSDDKSVQDETERELKNKKDEKLKSLLKDGPFIRHKKTSSTQTKKSSELIKEKTEKNGKEYVRNKFICMGKTMNLQITQKQSKINANSFDNIYSSIFLQENNLQKKVMSYHDYKNIMNNLE